MLCLNVQCSDQFNQHTFGQILVGMTILGSWACFTDFNKVNLSVLSVIATQLSQLHKSIQRKDDKINLLGFDIPLSDSVGVFVTMKLESQYQMPLELKLFFRPVSMICPDMGFIAYIMLSAEGFENPKTMS